MNHWTKIDAALAAHGYHAVRDFATLGDCPPHIAKALGGAADARIAGTDDHGTPTPGRAVGMIEAMLAGVPDPPEWLPIRIAGIDPPIRAYRRGPLADLFAAADRRGMTDQQIADVCGTHRPNVNAWRNGRGDPKIGSIWPLADHLGVRLTKPRGK